ncbi:C-type lectin domain family 4 member M-like [Strongylocentrotus purpuratus]|uniref:C-type lectin domain-containing protein n=1 Tax=Strongylocentrotus purpuratus TaxID=7668 RepID=A0A7M7T4E5_STRPU|nr:C-type lectin domain family 4 member M-like [Strongylocentrotus purpuratus]
MELSFFVIFVILNQHSPVTANLACESDQSENDGSCYYFSESESNFATSKSSCEDLGMHLVSIGSQEEQNFMQSSISSGNKELWIGLSRLTWIDGSSLDYNNFANGEYDNYFASQIFDDGGICFEMTELQSQWFDSSCSGASYYICENEIEDNAGTYRKLSIN